MTASEYFRQVALIDALILQYSKKAISLKRLAVPENGGIRDITSSKLIGLKRTHRNILFDNQNIPIDLNTVKIY